MNLFKIEPPFRRSKKSKDLTEATREVAERLYLNRQVMKLSGSAEGDWAKAERILKSPIRQFLFRLNQPLIQAEKRAIEPFANWVDRADLFRIIERLSPTLEALGVIAIPLVLFFAAQSYQANLRQQELDQLQQQAVTDYLNQLSTVLLEMDGTLHDPQNEELRTLTAATTLTLLGAPNLNGVRKGQVIRLLSQLELVQRRFVAGSQRPEEKAPVISLREADLSSANLSSADFRSADLSLADLRSADLRDADLHSADLHNADLRGANLRNVDFRSADLRFASLRDADLSFADFSLADLYEADLRNVDLRNADLRNADLRFASFRDADLRNADLRNADLRFASLRNADLSFARDVTQSQLEYAYLCKTQFPEEIALDSDRDC